MINEFGGAGMGYAPPMSYSAGGQQNLVAGQTPTGQTPAQAQNNAFDIFRNSTNYQFRLGEGMNALNSGLASSGILQSGAAMREAQRYGQDFASNEFGNYMAYLGNQQGVGLGGASALAGVGQGYANNITSLNMQNASNLGNAAIARANNSNALLGNIAGGIGNIVGSGIFGKL